MFKRIGPGFLVTAAFIGPGTIITCASTGVGFGISLIWALIVGIAVTVLFQEMAARSAIHNQEGLSETAVSITKDNIFLKWAVRVIIIIAILFGNAAYESGNLIGATIGFENLLSVPYRSTVLIIISIFITSMLWWGGYKTLEKTFIVLVFLMGIVFVILLFLVDFGNLDTFISYDDESGKYFFSALALIGTTVVPYNLFLHSRSIKSKWGEQASLQTVRVDLILSIVIGGLISVSILIVFAAIPNGASSTGGLTDLTLGLEREYGLWSRYLVSAGIFFAGLTSSMTAPLAASYAISGLFELTPKQKTQLEKVIWLVVIAIGMLVGLTDIKPITIIQMAQFANGLLLPLIAIILLYVLNQAKSRVYRNGPISNSLGAIVIIFLILIGVRSILLSLGIW